MGAWYQCESRLGGQSGWRYSSSNELALRIKSPVTRRIPACRSPAAHLSKMAKTSSS